jgi:CheY-like chemotaxis protein
MQGTKKPRTPVRLVLVDDNPEVLETVGRLLEADFDVQSTAGTGHHHS